MELGIREYMVLMPEITKEDLELAKQDIADNKFLPFQKTYAIVSRENQDYLKLFTLEKNTKEERKRIVNEVIKELQRFGRIKEIDVREDDESVHFWIDGSEYGFLPYESEE